MVIIALAVAAISMTVTRSSLFKPLRKRTKLLRCPYCFAHYVSFALTLSYIPLDPFDFIIKVFATVALSTVPMIIIEYLNQMVDKNARLQGSSGISP